MKDQLRNHFKEGKMTAKFVIKMILIFFNVLPMFVFLVMS